MGIGCCRLWYRFVGSISLISLSVTVHDHRSWTDSFNSSSPKGFPKGCAIVGETVVLLLLLSVVAEVIVLVGLD